MANIGRMAYIDSEISKSRSTPIQTPAEISRSSTVEQRFDTTEPRSTDALSTASAPRRTNNPYHLSEVIVPPKGDSPPPQRPRIRKPRLGHDGKPLPPRKPRRRPSEDMARDALVEQILHEHAPEQSNSPMPQVGAGHNDQPSMERDNDEAFAARFRADFLNQTVEQQARDEAKRTNKAAATDVKTGPKLGGSRTDRAKMAQAQAQAQQSGGSK